MDNKKLTVMTLAVFVVGFLVEMAWGYGVTMGQMDTNRNAGIPWHNPTTHGWVVAVIVDLLFSLAFAYVFLRGYEGKGVAEGIRYGIWITLLASVPANFGYATMLHFGRRIPVEMTVGDLITFVLCGVVAAALAGAPQYAPRSAARIAAP